MTSWQFFVAIFIRQALNLNYDDLEMEFNQNMLVREFLQLSRCDKIQFLESCLGKNCRIVSDKTIDEINDAVVEVSMEMGFKDGKVVRGDYLASKTNIHYPSDTKAIKEAVRKVVDLWVGITEGQDGWRQSNIWLKDVKECVREIVQTE